MCQNSVVKISMMFAKYFEYYTIILRGVVFSWTRCSTSTTTASLWPVYRTTYVSQNPQSTILLPACLCWQQRAHSN